MLKHILVCALVCMVLLPTARASKSPELQQPAAPDTTPTTMPAHPPIILLKLDDVGYWISPRWKRVADYLADKKIPVGFGIISSSLERAGPDTITWIKTHQDSGLVEFWLHGYTLRSPKDKVGEFENNDEPKQQAMLAKGEANAMAKLGFYLPAFGPHWSGTTDATDQALQNVPQIKIWLYGPVHPKYFTGLSIPRIMALENPTFMPDPVKFKATYEKIGCKQKVLVLQGHPDMWADDRRWKWFTEIVDFLQAQGCTFMTPSQYLASVNSAASAK